MRSRWSTWATLIKTKSNDGRTIYTATRSTGQLEEGPVGFSVTNLDGGAVSWRFFELGQLPAVMITSPADEPLLAEGAKWYAPLTGSLRVRAKVWAESSVQNVQARLGKVEVGMQRLPGSNVCETILPCGHVSSGIQAFHVIAEDASGNTACNEIRVLFGSERPAPHRAKRDQDNALDAWPEHGLLGTQLGPNKNGRKW